MQEYLGFYCMFILYMLKIFLSHYVRRLSISFELFCRPGIGRIRFPQISLILYILLYNTYIILSDFLFGYFQFFYFNTKIYLLLYIAPGFFLLTDYYYFLFFHFRIIFTSFIFSINTIQLLKSLIKAIHHYIPSI